LWGIAQTHIVNIINSTDPKLHIKSFFLRSHATTIPPLTSTPTPPSPTLRQKFPEFNKCCPIFTHQLNPIPYTTLRPACSISRRFRGRRPESEWEARRKSKGTRGPRRLEEFEPPPRTCIMDQYCMIIGASSPTNGVPLGWELPVEPWTSPAATHNKRYWVAYKTNAQLKFEAYRHGSQR
jgi:hypothetical protein